MQNKAILFSSLLLVSSSVLAEPSLLKEAAKQVAKDTATVVAPKAAGQADAAKQTLQNLKYLKEGVVNAPDAVKDQTKKAVLESIKQKINQATPEQTNKAVETLKLGKEIAKDLKEKVDNTPNAAKAIKAKAKEKAVGKALDLLR